ncbi:HTTM domain-containing protein [Ulvibacterium sp.]|uniref:HTTM domain-containing protein n=1 Tax=Ulvibacterium sp. TaxID=2665914 RepID=UPI0026040E8B|nr:HTTM domain-containing protein [Ulvibacterium sp.]
MLNRLLFTKVDNSPLIIFRIFFGFLIAAECYGALMTGWVRRNLVDPLFTFNFIGFDFLQVFQGSPMYVYFFIMGTLGIFVALGYKYRFSMIAFTILWTGAYLMQKTSYNNHYYLLILISAFMCLVPANRSHALDVRHNPSLKTDSMPGWIKWAVVLQLFIVYTYASVAKWYGDWTDFGIIKILMQDKADYYIIGGLLQERWVHSVIGIVGILFDLLIVPALLWKPTRKVAFFFSIFFHLFNSIVFQIGIFPYLSLAFSVFFFEPETIRSIFFKKKTPCESNKVEIPAYKNLLLLLAGIYFLVQILLPLRHHIIKDNVLWTEEGHRLSWRMMLRSRAGTIQFKIVHRETGKSEFVKLNDYLSKKQKRRLASYPDFVWQFAQYLKKDFAEKGEDISVYAVNSKVSINGRPYRAFIDPKTDLANVPWEPLRHHEWIFPSDFED